MPADAYVGLTVKQMQDNHWKLHNHRRHDRVEKSSSRRAQRGDHIHIGAEKYGTAIMSLAVTPQGPLLDSTLALATRN
jgi:hypothetical protein